MYLSVTEDLKGKSGIINLDVNDVWFIHFFSRKRIIEVHTETQILYMTGTLAYWQNALNTTYGFPFETVDRNIIVNVSQITCVDSVRSVAYFSSEITEKSKFCTFSQGNRKKIERLKKLNPSIATL
ncbi:LytTR family transcriptional regulator DNA-binding domain-containing protein [Paenibacillus sp. OV219]|uniref:LytTR family transcriptional regulator DNA-binding domain-containing protein n=1 Tax=Paenibacillus sp. OV219 TaxID=1884377 RepID=UPI0008BC74F0|nr:LytTr DNA-binding domain-containing protein [Paenibacillus sp. OV219]